MEAPMGENTEIVNRLLNSRLLQTEWVLWFLLGLFAVALIVLAWKAVYFIVNAVRAKSLRAQVSDLVGGADLEAFRDNIKELPGVEAAVMNHALRYVDNGPDVVEQQMGVALEQSKRRMGLGLTFLGTLGANAPFVGLYGTVGGIIKAFRDLSAQTEEAGISAVISGIAEALVATAVGLLVAIPAVVAFNYLQQQVKKVVGSSNALNQQVLFRLKAEEDE